MGGGGHENGFTAAHGYSRCTGAVLGRMIHGSVCLLLLQHGARRSQEQQVDADHHFSRTSLK
jgi:hypothetical protein